MNKIALLVTIFSFFSLHALDKSKMHRDLDVVATVFEAKYAPFEWKRTFADWSLENEIARAKRAVSESDEIDLHDYQRILHSFFMSTLDHHVHDFYYSTELSTLPFTIKSSGGRYFISYLYYYQLREMQNAGLYEGEQLPVIGDELLSFGGIPIQEAINQIALQEIGTSSFKTFRVLAENILTSRMRSLGHSVPQGKIAIKFQHEGSVIDAKMPWIYQPELISSSYPKTARSTAAAAIPESAIPWDKKMASPLAEALFQDRTPIINRFLSQYINQESLDALEDAETATSSMPAHMFQRFPLTLGHKVWEESLPATPFQSYIYLSPKGNKRIGYIRINTYMPSKNMNSVNAQAQTLANLLRFFEQTTDALVIDQVDNPGGIALYGYAVLSMLTDKPLTTLRHYFAITQEDVSKAIVDTSYLRQELLNSTSGTSLIAGYTKSKQLISEQINYNNFIINEWNSGRSLTTAFPFMGIDEIEPHPYSRYTKPIVMLVNSQDFSCADLVPAILQDNQRALIFGETTAGAGGVVEQHSYPNLFGLKHFSYTTTLMERRNGKPIENLGVEPDWPYEVTPDDLLNGYTGYIQEVNKAVESLLPLEPVQNL